jgi:hypothetical protein
MPRRGRFRETDMGNPLSEAIVESLLQEDGDFGSALHAFVAHLQKLADDYRSKWTPNIPGSTFEMQTGPKYVRIVKVTGPGKSAYCFVGKEDGNIWKPASWAGPTKNFSRGNVYKPESWGSHFGPHGV